MVFFDDLFRDVMEIDVDVFGSLEWCHEIEVGYIHCHEGVSLVDMMMLKRSLATSMSAVGVATLPV